MKNSVIQNATEPGPQPRAAWLGLCGLFLLLMIFVKPVPIGGDTALYAENIKKSLSHGWSESPELWNFPHVLWRPLGRLLSQAFLPTVEGHFNYNATMAIAFLLMLPNLIAAPAAGLAVQAAVWRLTGNAPAAFLTASSFLCLNPLLNYSRLGTPHLCALACVALAMYFAVFHADNWKTATITGLLAAIAVLFWAPLLVTVPSIVLARLILNFSGATKRRDFRFALMICVVSGLVVAGFYAVAMALNHIHSWSDLMAWIRESAGDSRDRKMLRMVNGLARGFYEMGRNAPSDSDR